VAALIGFPTPFTAGEATGAVLAGFFDVGATVVFFAADFTARFAFACLFFWASAICWRASGLTTRFVAAAEATAAVFALFTAAGVAALVAVLVVIDPAHNSRAQAA
jgi:hypothetical protein